jgi:CHAD domain-containing protein
MPAIVAAIGSAGESAGTAALRSLRARVARRRRVARDEARAAVVSRRYVQLVLAIGAFAARPQVGVAAGAPAAATLAMPARDFARPLLKHRQRQLQKRGESLPTAPPPARHAARLAAKRLRYATAFFAPLFPRKRARAYQAALARLQDVLGALNDAAVAAQIAAQVAGKDAPATTTLQGWAAAQSALRADELAAAWQHFTTARPFWRRG